MPRVWIGNNNNVGFGGSPGLSILKGVSEGIIEKRKMDEETKRQGVLNRLSEQQMAQSQQFMDIRQAQQDEWEAQTETRRQMFEDQAAMMGFSRMEAERLNRHATELDTATEALRDPISQHIAQMNPDFTPDQIDVVATGVLRTDLFREYLGDVMMSEEDRLRLEEQRARLGTLEFNRQQQVVQQNSLKELMGLYGARNAEGRSLIMGLITAAANGDEEGQAAYMTDIMNWAGDDPAKQMAAAGLLQNIPQPGSGMGGLSGADQEMLAGAVVTEVQQSVRNTAQMLRRERGYEQVESNDLMAMAASQLAAEISAQINTIIRQGTSGNPERQRYLRVLYARLAEAQRQETLYLGMNRGGGGGRDSIEQGAFKRMNEGGGSMGAADASTNYNPG